jgi:hypothetical protein
VVQGRGPSQSRASRGLLGDERHRARVHTHTDACARTHTNTLARLWQPEEPLREVGPTDGKATRGIPSHPVHLLGNLVHLQVPRPPPSLVSRLSFSSHFPFQHTPISVARAERGLSHPSVCCFVVMEWSFFAATRGDF